MTYAKFQLIQLVSLQINNASTFIVIVVLLDRVCQCNKMGHQTQILSVIKLNAKKTLIT